jgi:site-specific DNA recombinase
MSAPQVLGYVRVSTEKQAEGGVSLAAQTAKIRAMAEVKGVEVTEILVDATSAKSLDRPEMTRLLALVDARAVATVIIAKLDRLTRSIRDLSDLLDRFERRGVSLVSVAESLDTRSSAGRLVINIMGSVAQWEREAIGERTREGLQHKRTKAECVGTLPFGFQLDAASARIHLRGCEAHATPVEHCRCGGRFIHLAAAPAEQRILARARTLRADGYTQQQIADDLNADGWTTRRGTPWRFQYIARMLKASA